MKFRIKIFLIALLILQIGLTSCNNKNAPDNSLTISAAMSLKDSLEEIKIAYLKSNPDTKIIYNFGSSGSLQRQIEEGGKVDIFISASEKNMANLEKNKLILKDTKKILVKNNLVLINNINSYPINTINDLTSSKINKIGIGEPETVPAGQYAYETLKNLNIFDKLKPKLIYAKNVREVLTWAETNNIDAGFIYESDLKAADNLRLIAKIPESLHKPIIYPVAVIKSSQNIDQANEFIKFLSGKKAKSIFKKYGFR